MLEDTAYLPSLTCKFTVADLIAGGGVAKTVRHYYALWPGTAVAGKRIVIKAGTTWARRRPTTWLARGALVVSIIDWVGGLLRPIGLPPKKIRDLFLGCAGNALYAPYLLSFAEVDRQVWTTKTKIFVPTATSRLMTQTQVEALVTSGLEVISCGANASFTNPAIFFGPTGKWAGTYCTVIPDFIASCGMADVFAHLMETGTEITDQAIFQDVSHVIEVTLARAGRATRPPTWPSARSGWHCGIWYS